MSKLLDLDELNQVDQPYSRAKNIKTYEFFLEQCHKKIKEYNKLHRSKFCYYKPPLFLIGKPMYDYMDVMNYLVECLTKNGLMARITEEGILICWDQRVLDNMSYQRERTRLESVNQNERQTDPSEPKIHSELPRPKPKPKPKAQSKTASNVRTHKADKSGEKVINIITFENDDFPVNLDGFK